MPVHTKAYSADWVLTVRDEVTGEVQSYVTAEYIAKRRACSTSTITMHVRKGNLVPIELMGRFSVFKLEDAQAFIPLKFVSGAKPKTAV